MPTVGITGGIAGGKTTVAQMLADLGAIVISADEIAREITAPGSEALIEIERRFGGEYIRDDGSLDRAKLGAHVFRSKSDRSELEAITHPRIGALLRRRISDARKENPKAVIAVEVPLLFEAGMQDWFDAVVTVVTSREKQLERLKAKGLTKDDAVRRIGAQMRIEEKAELADYVIRNDGDMAALTEAVKGLWKNIEKSG